MVVSFGLSVFSCPTVGVVFVQHHARPKRPARTECYNFLYYFKSVGSTTLPTHICPSRRAMDRCP